jgi:hypothetical protein
MSPMAQLYLRNAKKVKNDTVWNKIKQSFFDEAIVLIAVQKFLQN